MPLPREKRKDPQEVRPEAQTTKDGEEGTPKAQKKKKQKATKLPLNTALTEDDYELMATRMHDMLKESFEAMQTSQEKLHSMVEK